MKSVDSEFIKKTGLYLIGNFASKIIMAIMLPLYAYFISVEELGVFDYSQTMMHIISPILFIALWEAILRFLVAEKDNNQKNDVICTAVTFYKIVLSLIIFIGFFSILGKDKINFYVIIMTGVYGSAQIWQYFARALKYNEVYVKASITGTIINFVVLIFTVCVWKLGGIGLFIAYILGQGSILFLIEKKIKVLNHAKNGSFKWAILKAMLIFSIPLVLNLTSTWLISGFGRFIITNKLGSYDNGLYSFGMKFGSIISMLGSVVSMALIEQAIIKSDDKDIDEYFSIIIEKVFKIFIFICICAMPVIKIFYLTISDTEYIYSYNMVPIFLVYAILMTMATNIGAIFQAKNRTNVLFYTTIIGALVTIIGSLILIEQYKIIGVAISQLIGASAMVLSRWIYANKLIKFNIQWRNIVLLILNLIILIVIFNFGLTLFSLFISFVIILMSAMLNKEIINSAYGMIKIKFKK